ncbi:MAG: phosphate acyltransferase PlsX [Clostridia bacterium]|nr:phosphate acyltransferase PlsX [Clostridia bacterium]
MKRILVDVMGGDHAPLEMVKGAHLAADELDCELVLIGNEEAIRRVAAENDLDPDRFEIVHTEAVITMEDSPIAVRRAKADSSMGISLRMLAEGKGDAMVSTGNTGALFAGATLIVRKIGGLHCPAIAALLPMQPPVLLLDSGANLNVSAEDLEQFAVMGSVYMRQAMGVENPRVGLLNNGSEETKGTSLQIEAYRLLSENTDLNFVGNVEGNRVMQDVCDVLVTDGFSGNILLKTMEGMGKLMLKTMKDLFYKNTVTKAAALAVKPYLGEVKKSFDAGEYGGAPILGVQKPVIKAHGSSDAKAFKNAIRQALSCAEKDLTGDLASAISALSYKRKEEKEKAEPS